MSQLVATIKKINSNGILYILEIIEDNMDLKHKQEFLKIIEKKLETLSSSDSEKLDNF